MRIFLILALVSTLFLSFCKKSGQKQQQPEENTAEQLKAKKMQEKYKPENITLTKETIEKYINTYPGYFELKKKNGGDKKVLTAEGATKFNKKVEEYLKTNKWDNTFHFYGVNAKIAMALPFLSKNLKDASVMPKNLQKEMEKGYVKSEEMLKDTEKEVLKEYADKIVSLYKKDMEKMKKK